jgi:hypothetical protein
MKLQNIGVIGEVTLPDNWYERADKKGAGSGRTFSPNETTEAEIVFFPRMVPLDEASRKVFLHLLKEGENDALSDELILALRTVLGVATAGDNQITNSGAPGTLEGPVFLIDNARTVDINGKVVLRIVGDYTNGKSFNGIFYPAGAEGKIVEELFLQTTKNESIDNYLTLFEKVLSTVKWR